MTIFCYVRREEKDIYQRGRERIEADEKVRGNWRQEIIRTLRRGKGREILGLVSFTGPPASCPSP